LRVKIGGHDHAQALHPAHCSLLTLLAGCTTNGGGSQASLRDEVPPVVVEFTITPPANGWRAGACRVTLRATDNRRVKSVVVQLAGPNAGSDPVDLLLVAGSRDRFEGDVPVPANSSSGGKENKYSVTGWVIDVDGNTAAVAESLTFTVPPPPQPPAAPGTW